jgi:two-component system nitrate/nitrite response regulator NarL
VTASKIWLTRLIGRFLSNMPKPSILLVDDHGILLEGVSNLLSTSHDYEVKSTATSGREALQLLKTNEYDVLITDYELPDITGLEVIKAARTVLPNIKVIVLSMHDDPAVVKELLRAGINGYILKYDTHKNLLEALSKVMNNRKYLSDEISEVIVQMTDDPSRGGLLTAREVEILKLVAKEFNSRQIAEILFISERTVETHRKNIIKKTGVTNLVGLIKYAYANNLI